MFMQVQIFRHFILHQFLFVEDFYIGSTFPTTWFNLPHAWGKLNRKNDVFRFQFMQRI